ncbi:uncharacterized protein F4812DRAFT_311352 [Daldinia caldariorum]|uniref:uncharacterized protein n=1 Tax=Daldinia caldariorum TaxID=326644 RepID=UPI0020084C1E|nr:uncharacterized protein F4812DRAFT_311352 [Daldinia caldariorum]KAI1470066.1 hypothetical protein F4812DRAFT_311352 [Daldinia caldariorum]
MYMTLLSVSFLSLVLVWFRVSCLLTVIEIPPPLLLLSRRRGVVQFVIARLGIHKQVNTYIVNRPPRFLNKCYWDGGVW